MYFIGTALSSLQQTGTESALLQICTNLSVKSPAPFFLHDPEILEVVHVAPNPSESHGLRLGAADSHLAANCQH